MFKSYKMIFSVLFLSFIFNQNSIYIPDDYSTIQAGINAANDGDTVFVSPGTYYENINFNGKNISLIGEDRETTIIDGNQNDVVIRFVNNENNSSLLKSFTIKNGNGGVMGGGIEVYYSSPIFDDLIVENNGGSNHGGGIALEGGSTLIKNSIIRNNSSITGGGIYCIGSPTLSKVIINNNTSACCMAALVRFIPSCSTK